MSNLLKATTLESATSPTVRSGISLMFIDAGLAQGDLLARSAAASTEVYYLRQDQDAIAQISQVLQGRSGIESLHILSHGSSGGLNFAGSELTLATLPSKVMELRSWQSALSENADILLYGCDVASNAAGSAFINLLGQATGADIAASTDLTGFGGNWTLEASTGAIEASAIAPNGYQGTLAPPVITNTPIANITYIENAVARTNLFGGASTITDTDNPANFNTGSIRVAVSTGKTIGDTLAITPGANGVTLDGTQIRVNSLAVATLSGGFNGEDLVIRFNASSTLATASAVLRSITYANFSENVATQTTGAKSLSVTVTDNAGEISNAVTIGVNTTGATDSILPYRTTVLYSANGTSSPNSATGAANGPWLNFQESGGTSTVTSTATDTTLTSGSIATLAGYNNYATVDQTATIAGTSVTIPTFGARLKSADYTLNNLAGYKVSFTAQLTAESHPGQDSVTGGAGGTTTDRNGDGKGDRAGFSVLIVSEDTTKSIELGFWNDRIFAQDDAVNQVNKALYGTVPSTADDNLTMFTSAETVLFDTTRANLNYEVLVRGDLYTLLANGEAILSGRLRNYTTAIPVVSTAVTALLQSKGLTTDAINPYKKQSLIFLGDNTSDASSTVKISQISVGTFGTPALTAPPVSGIAGLPIALRPFTLSNPDNANFGTVKLEHNSGTLTIQSGILPSNVTINRTTDASTGKRTITIEGATFAQINQLLNTPGGLTYQSSTVGNDSVSLTIGTSTSPLTIASIANNSAGNTREIIWRNEATGEIGMQYYNSSLGYLTAKSLYYLTEDAQGLVGNVKGDWQIKVLADFNGDGTTDALWQNSVSGDIGVWEMKGNVITGWKQFSYQENSQTISLGSLPTNWQVLNLGKTRPAGSTNAVDALFLQNTTTGEVGVWQLNGFNVVIAGSGLVTDTNNAVLKPGSEWRVTNWDDFDGDGATDALFQNTRTGELAIWEFNGKQAKSLYSIGTPAASANVSLFATGQYTFGDSKADLVWVDKTTKKLTIDPITNKAINPAGTQLGAANNSTLGNPIYAADFNGDNKRELFWYNSSTGKFSLSTFEILNGSNPVTAIADNIVNAPLIPANWYITAVGDFTGSAATVF